MSRVCENYVKTQANNLPAAAHVLSVLAEKRPYSRNELHKVEHTKIKVHYGYGEPFVGRIHRNSSELAAVMLVESVRKKPEAQSPSR